MTHLLLDEMWPPRAARLLREKHGRASTHVFEEGLRATEDEVIADHARRNGWALVTENVIDFASESDVVLVFVRKRALPTGGARASALAELLARWDNNNPVPYVGAHWPS